MTELKGLDWFIERIGKRIYRNDNQCPCNTCKEVEKNGLVIHDKQHATYLYDTQVAYATENILLNYRDKK